MPNLRGLERLKRWSRRVRADPRTGLLYRIGIGLLGLLLVLLGLLTGAFPGPGGIPLVLIGVALWSTEFRWARRLRHWFMQQIARFRSWSGLRQFAAAGILLCSCLLLVYVGMVLWGLPPWLPSIAKEILAWLPGL